MLKHNVWTVLTFLFAISSSLCSFVSTNKPGKGDGKYMVVTVGLPAGDFIKKKKEVNSEMKDVFLPWVASTVLI